MFIAIAAGVGLILGSFLSVLLERLPVGAPGIVAGRSECPHCHHQLAWYDLVPLFSYATLRGRCRYCGERISLLYPVLEINMAVVFAFSVALHGINAIELVVLFGLVALFFFDLLYQILPDVIVFPMIALAALWLFAGHQAFQFWGPVAAVALFLLFGGLYAVSRGKWLGFGDVKLAFLIGLLFGRGAVGVTLVAIWGGALMGLALMALGRANRQTALPFGSFWAAAAIAAILWPDTFYWLSTFFLSYGIR